MLLNPLYKKTVAAPSIVIIEQYVLVCEPIIWVWSPVTGFSCILQP